MLANFKSDLRNIKWQEAREINRRGTNALF